MAQVVVNLFLVHSLLSELAEKRFFPLGMMVLGFDPGKVHQLTLGFVRLLPVLGLMTQILILLDGLWR